MVLLSLSLSASAADVEATISELVERMTAASSAVVDGTWLIRMDEWKDGRVKPTQEIEVKYRRSPEALYMHWVGDFNTGREVLWAPASRDGNLYVSTSPLIPNLSIDATGALATRDSRHPVWMAELPRIAELVQAGADHLASNDELTAAYTDLGVQDVFGTRSHCYIAELPYEAAPAAFYAPKIKLCLSTATGLPSRFTAWADEDGARRQVEDYVFKAVTVNIGLSDADFDEDNPAYGF